MIRLYFLWYLTGNDNFNHMNQLNWFLLVWQCMLKMCHCNILLKSFYHLMPHNLCSWETTVKQQRNILIVLHNPKNWYLVLALNCLLLPSYSVSTYLFKQRQDNPPPLFLLLVAYSQDGEGVQVQAREDECICLTCRPPEYSKQLTYIRLLKLSTLPEKNMIPETQ
jgi:hypothetical protein